MMVSTTARDACISIMKHYSDPIHHTIASSSSSSSTNNLSEEESIAVVNVHLSSTLPPYFDSVLGRPMPELPPVSAFWYRRLLLDASAGTTTCGSSMSSNESTPNDATMMTSRGAAFELLICYESVLHPCVKRRRTNEHIDKDHIESETPLNAVVEVVRNYELLVAHLMRVETHEQALVQGGNVVNDDESISSPIDIRDSTKNPVIKSSDASAETNNMHNPEQDVRRIVATIADDILQWSAKLPKNDHLALFKVRNVILPCLLRLIIHFVVLLPSYKHRVSGAEFNIMFRHCLAIATVSAVPFVGDGKLKSGVFGCGCLLDWISGRNIDEIIRSPEYNEFSIAYTLNKCSLPPELPASLATSDFMTRSVVDWSAASAHFGAPWSDGVTGTGSRVAMQLLHSIYQSSCSIASCPLVEENSVNSSSDNSSSDNIRLLLRNISDNIGVEILVSTVCATFYCRPMFSGSVNTNAMTIQPQSRGLFMHMVQRQNKSNEFSNKPAAVTIKLEEKPHIQCPMRISAVAILLSAVNFHMQDGAFSDAIIIALCLLDDVQSIHQAFGAIISMSVFEAASTSVCKIPLFVEKFSTILTTSFTDAIQMLVRTEPPILTCVCLAQTKWIRLLGLLSMHNHVGASLSTSAVQQMASKSAAILLNAMGKQVHSGGRDGNDERIAGAFVAGINPLLAYLAESPYALSIEIARAGLATILPLIGWSGTRLEVRAAQNCALVGLVSLMMGSYPIMFHHGKKIMTEGFLLLDRADKDFQYLRTNKSTHIIAGGQLNAEAVSTNVTIILALHSAAVTLAICKDSAKTVLDHIMSTQSTNKRLVGRCLEIQTNSVTLKGGKTSLVQN